jgi:hypothetical protein
MSFPIVRALRQSTGSARRRPVQLALEVELMEAKTLLTSAAVTAAIVSVQQAEVAVEKSIATEIATLKANIVTIEKATATFDTTYAKGNKTLTALASRDETYAIAQQTFLISVLTKTESAYSATLDSGISALKSGKLAPSTIPNILSTGESNLTAELSTVNSTATYELDGLTGTFAAGKA